MMKQKRALARLALPMGSVVGVAAAFGVVMAWFPRGSEVWNLPIQQIDAPAHYYFIRRILDDGIGAAMHLLPNDGYYPPMFHLLAAGLIRLAGFFGVTMNIYAAFNMVWLAAAGLVWPAGMQLFAGYWTRRVDGKSRSWRPFSTCMALIVPLLSVSSACYPFFTLASGPLVTFSLATSLLPFWLFATLRLFDEIASHGAIFTWSLVNVLLGGLCLFAHPRIAFTWLLLMAPFALVRLPWKLLATMVGAVVVLAAAFFLYMRATYRSSRYLDPGSWFHTFTPNRSVPDALRVLVTENIPGPAGIGMAVVVLASVAVMIAVIVRPQLVRVALARTTLGDDARAITPSPAIHEADDAIRNPRKDAIGVLAAFLLVGVVYVCSTALEGWFPNIVAAAWYRSEPRPLTMLPLGILPLIVVAVVFVASFDRVAAHGDPKSIVAAGNTGNDPDADRQSPRSQHLYRTGIAVTVVAALAVGSQFGNATRSEMSVSVRNTIVLGNEHPDEQLTEAKYEVLQRIVRRTGTQAVIISDPLNGSMYGTTIFGANMLYPIYNPKHEKNGAIFGQVEQAFASGQAEQLLKTVCPIGPSTPEYFMTMGPQAPSLQMFTFKEQYDPFHDEGLIKQYVSDGTLVKIEDFGDVGDVARGWALYRFGCAS